MVNINARLNALERAFPGVCAICRDQQRVVVAVKDQNGKLYVGAGEDVRPCRCGKEPLLIVTGIAKNMNSMKAGAGDLVPLDA